MEKFFYKKTLIAIRFRKIKEGAIPLTDPSEPLQVLTHKRKKGKETKAHIHVPKKRTTKTLQECLVMISGKIKIDLYSPDRKKFKSIYLLPGQTIVFVAGGHGVQILEDCELIEIKNGPFINDKLFIE